MPWRAECLTRGGLLVDIVVGIVGAVILLAIAKLVFRVVGH